MEKCSCGSGEEPWELKDARGIFCSYICVKCEAKIHKGFRQEIFSNSQYWAIEQIEPEEY